MNALKTALDQLRHAPRRVQFLALSVCLVGLHSLVLGTFIFFCTRFFYRLFFRVDIENLFFVRQAGLFLFCLGLFYLVPLMDLKKGHRLVMIIILTKVLAVFSLVANASITARPAIMLLTAAGDGSMALLLALLYFRARPCLKESENGRQ